MLIGTIVSHDHLARARTLAASLRRHNPDVELVAAVVGEGRPPAGEPFQVISEHDLGVADIERRRRAYSTFEYAVSFKPALLAWLLAQDPLAVYLDADVYVTGSFEPLAAVLGSGDVALTPHLVRALPDDGLQPSAANILLAGSFNSGFVAVRATAGGAGFLRWWGERLATGCLHRPADGYFADQRWLDLAPGLFAGVRILRDSAWNLGHWNLPGEELSGPAGGWRIGGRPLRAYHFSGFAPESPRRLSAVQNRTAIRAGSPLAELCQEYAAALIANGHGDIAAGGRTAYHGGSPVHRVRLSLGRWRALARAHMGRE